MTESSPGSQPEPDALFAEPRLAACYDVLDGERDDLPHYRAILAEHGARTVIDIGCGTGSLAALLAADGLAVTGIDPALASLEVARAKPHAESATWLHGTAEDLPPLAADAAVMTGNVAQVFTTDEAWAATLRGGGSPAGRSVGDGSAVGRAAVEGKSVGPGRSGRPTRPRRSTRCPGWARSGSVRRGSRSLCRW